MDEKLKSFMTNIGILCETWTIVYHNFVKLGFDHKEAIVHTKEFMGSVMKDIGQNRGQTET